jgi:hypothetical protein
MPVIVTNWEAKVGRSTASPGKKHVCEIPSQWKKLGTVAVISITIESLKQEDNGPGQKVRTPLSKQSETISPKLVIRW